jgi:phage repressor protein C with HTH and peptisase S24 domain
MAPTLCRGDLVIYRRGAAVREGDVVFVSKPGWPEGVLHRVISVSPDGGLMLKGDANSVPDRDAVSRSAVRGICALVVPTGRAYLGAGRVLARWYNLPSPAA